MLALDSNGPQKKVRPNVLPCQVAYNGPVNANTRYWNPKQETDGSQTVYFRGRKLQGKKTALPNDFEGVVLQKTDRTIIDVPRSNQGLQHSGHEDEEEDDFDDESAQPAVPRELKVAEQVGTFDGITTWNHESVPLDTEDAYIKGMQEWIALAKAIHT